MSIELIGRQSSMLSALSTECHAHEEDPEEVERLTKEYEEALADEQDAASRASAAADRLRELGVEVD